MIDFKKHIQKLSEETFDELLFEGNLRNQVKLHTEEWPKLPLGGLAILALPNAASPNTDDLNFQAAEAIRKKLYASAPLSFAQPITDLGNFTLPLSDENASEVVGELLFHLFQQNHRLLLIGGNSEDAKAFIAALEPISPALSVAYVSPIFAFSSSPIAKTREKYLYECFQKANGLRTFQIASQIHLHTFDVIETFKERHSTYSLGKINNDILGAEAILRDTVFHTFSTDSLSRPFFQANRFSQAFGLTAHQFAQLAYYAGHSLNNRIAHFADYQVEKDSPSLADAQTLATAIWYFMDGANFLQSEGDFKDSQLFEIFIVIDRDSNAEMEFLKSKITGRVWRKTINEAGEEGYESLSKAELLSNHSIDFPPSWFNN